MIGREEAERVAARVGFEEGRPEWETAVEIAMRGWPAWRIAQHFRLNPDLIHELGGPVPPSPHL
jgi:hypothetical protein